MWELDRSVSKISRTVQTSWDSSIVNKSEITNKYQKIYKIRSKYLLSQPEKTIIQLTSNSMLYVRMLLEAVKILSLIPWRRRAENDTNICVGGSTSGINCSLLKGSKRAPDP